mmetsp:Transcript_54504/g.154395  ORF Transcript_54504/g.154395 Transcript_54504/m.154395 type:complete len:256 (-) Transcript_54504:7-774(-)
MRLHGSVASKEHYCPSKVDCNAEVIQLRRLCEWRRRDSCDEHHAARWAELAEHRPRQILATGDMMTVADVHIPQLPRVPRQKNKDGTDKLEREEALTGRFLRVVDHLAYSSREVAISRSEPFMKLADVRVEELQQANDKCEDEAEQAEYRAHKQQGCALFPFVPDQEGDLVIDGCRSLAGILFVTKLQSASTVRLPILGKLALQKRLLQHGMEHLLAVGGASSERREPPSSAPRTSVAFQNRAGGANPGLREHRT